MIKNLLSFFGLITFFSFNAQNNFEYTRTWGTYFGPVGTKAWTEYPTPSILFDSQNNIYTNGFIISVNNNYPNSYFDQFTIGGGQNFYQNATGSTYNIYNSMFNSAGVLQKYEYYSGVDNQGGYKKILKYIDNNDNKYYEYAFNHPLQASTGAWFMNPVPEAKRSLIVKESSNGNILWSTFSPAHSPSIYGDDAGNTYITGSTKITQNISTQGAFQQNYQLTYNNYGNEIQNGFIVKLNSSGEKIWGTYFPGFIIKLVYHNGSIYFIGSPTISNPTVSITTANAFQTTNGAYFVEKFNSTTGQQIWGTFYGPLASGNTGTRMNHIAVNDYGLYVMGDSNITSSNYFGTTNAHQSSSGGSWDIFLSKFDLNGNRSWSTYFGGAGTELLQNIIHPLALSREDIYISGYVWGMSNLGTSNAYQPSPQTNTNTSTNQFFAKFNTQGNLIWSSYYGGTNFTYNTPINIAYHNSSLYLFGETTSTSGFTTPGSWQPQIQDPNPSVTNQEKNVTFLAKFDPKTLATLENNNSQKLILYDNPNNGNFSLKGDILEKENCILKIYDMSGKLIHSKTLEKKKLQNIELKGQLPHGNYIIQVNDSKNNSLENFKMIVKN